MNVKMTEMKETGVSSHEDQEQFNELVVQLMAKMKVYGRCLKQVVSMKGAYENFEHSQNVVGNILTDLHSTIQITKMLGFNKKHNKAVKKKKGFLSLDKGSNEIYTDDDLQEDLDPVRNTKDSPLDTDVDNLVAGLEMGDSNSPYTDMLPTDDIYEPKTEDDATASVHENEEQLEEPVKREELSDDDNIFQSETAILLTQETEKHSQDLSNAFSASTSRDVSTTPTSENFLHPNNGTVHLDATEASMEKNDNTGLDNQDTTDTALDNQNHLDQPEKCSQNKAVSSTSLISMYEEICDIGNRTETQCSDLDQSLPDTVHILKKECDVDDHITETNDSYDHGPFVKVKSIEELSICSQGTLIIGKEELDRMEKQIVPQPMPSEVNEVKIETDEDMDLKVLQSIMISSSEESDTESIDLFDEMNEHKRKRKRRSSSAETTAADATAVETTAVETTDDITVNDVKDCSIVLDRNLKKSCQLYIRGGNSLNMKRLEELEVISRKRRKASSSPTNVQNKKLKPDASSDSDSVDSINYSGVGEESIGDIDQLSDVPMDNINETGDVFESILKDMRDSDSDDQSLTDMSDNEGKGPNKDKAVCSDKKKKTKQQPVSQWKKDKLLTSQLDTDSDKELDTNTTKEKTNNKDKSENKDTDSIVEDQVKEEPVFRCSFEEDIFDSDCEFVSYDKEKKKKKKKKSNEEGDNTETDTNSDSEFDTPRKSGRRNIRAVLSEETLNVSTILANQKEKERVERLKEQKNMMSQIISGTEDDFILDATEDNVIKVHPDLTKRLKKHQVTGVRFMWDACYESVNNLKTMPGGGCILAHCMGLGKSFQVVTLVHTLFANPVTQTNHVLIVCPLSTVLNWKNEFNIALNVVKSNKTAINIFTISSEQTDRKARKLAIERWWRAKGVLLMGYETFMHLVFGKQYEGRDKIMECLVKPGPDLIVCDEGHLLKNGKTNRTKSLMTLTSKRRIILTGTPMQNNLAEYYHMVQFVKPNLLGTYKEYTNRFANPISNGQYDDSTTEDIMLMKKRSHVLHSILRNTVQRFEVTELQPYLPIKMDYVLFVPLHPVQAVIYRKFIENFHLGVETKNKLFPHYHMLMSVWTHPYMLHLKQQPGYKLKKKKEASQIGDIPDNVQATDLPSNWWKEFVPDDFCDNIDYGPKLKIMFSVIEECEKTKEKLLIFSSSIVEMDVIEYFLKKKYPRWKQSTNYLRMDGTVQPDVRAGYCNLFNKENNNIRLFLISIKVGGLGLNLVGANRVILMDVSWNPSFDSQSIFRIYRFGQKKNCYIYRLVSKGTMEEVVYERSVTKQAIAGRVVDEMQISRHYKCRDLEAMYRCNVDNIEERPIPKLPLDNLLANLLQKHTSEIFSYHEHESLLENLPEEELDDSTMKIAWEEFNREKNPPPPPPQPLPQALDMNHTGSDVNSAVANGLANVRRNLQKAYYAVTRPGLNGTYSKVYVNAAKFHGNGKDKMIHPPSNHYTILRNSLQNLQANESHITGNNASTSNTTNSSHVATYSTNVHKPSTNHTNITSNKGYNFVMNNPSMTVNRSNNSNSYASMSKPSTSTNAETNPSISHSNIVDSNTNANYSAGSNQNSRHPYIAFNRKLFNESPPRHSNSGGSPQIRQQHNTPVAQKVIDLDLIDSLKDLDNRNEITITTVIDDDTSVNEKVIEIE